MSTALELSHPCVEAVYERIVRSSVWITHEETCEGASGVLIGERRVITNSHVVAGRKGMIVYAPLHEPSGNLWAREDYFAESQRVFDMGFSTWAEVIADIPSKDLAVLLLERNLTGLCELPVASEIPAIGSPLHVVGCPLGRELFSYSFGATSYVGRMSWVFDGGQFVDADVITFIGTVFFGNSGGAVVDRNSELVGIVAGSNKTGGTAIAAGAIQKILAAIE